MQTKPTIDPDKRPARVAAPQHRTHDGEQLDGRIAGAAGRSLRATPTEMAAGTRRG